MAAPRRERGSPSPSRSELIDRPPRIFEPPTRSCASPPLTEDEIDDLTNPNLPYKTSYTYADSILYRSDGPSYYRIPNMHDGRHHYNFVESYSKFTSTSENALTASPPSFVKTQMYRMYITIIEFFESIFQGAATGGRGIISISIFTSIFYFIIYGFLTVVQYILRGITTIGSALIYPFRYKSVISSTASQVRRRNIDYDSEFDEDGEFQHELRQGSAAHYEPLSSIRQRIGFSRVRREPVYSLRSRTIARDVTVSTSSPSSSSINDFFGRVHFSEDATPPSRAAGMAAAAAASSTRAGHYERVSSHRWSSGSDLSRSKFMKMFDKSIAYFKHPFVTSGAGVAAAAARLSRLAAATMRSDRAPSPIVTYDEESSDESDNDSGVAGEGDDGEPLIQRHSTYSTSQSRYATQSSSLFHIGGIGHALADSASRGGNVVVNAFLLAFLFIYNVFATIFRSFANAVMAVHELAQALVLLLALSFGSIFRGLYRGILAAGSVLLSGVSLASTYALYGIVSFGNGVAAVGSGVGRAVTAPGMCSKLFWFLLVPLLLAVLLFLRFGDPKMAHDVIAPYDKSAAEQVELYAKTANSILEDYYRVGAHLSISYWDMFKNAAYAFFARIADGLRIMLQLFAVIAYSSFSYIMDTLAMLRIDRFFQASTTSMNEPPSPPPPPPVFVPPPPPPSIDCPQASPPCPDPTPSVEMQEQLVAAVVTKVLQNIDQRMDERFIAVDERVSKAKEELRGHVSLDYTALDIMIREALRKYDADKTGLPDFALESAGGAVVSTRCSETYPLSTRLEKIFNIPLYYSNYGPRVVIQRNSQGLIPGECWAFKGSVGYLTLKLAHPIKVSAVSYEHIQPSLTPGGENKSAPRTFSIFAYMNDENDFKSRTLLGTFEYINSTEPLQVFPIKVKPEFSVQYIEMQVESNWGEEYTCLYRIRVHGDLEK